MWSIRSSGARWCSNGEKAGSPQRYRDTEKKKPAWAESLGGASFLDFELTEVGENTEAHFRRRDFLLRKQVRRDLLKKQDSSLARSGSRMNKGLGRVDCLRERPQAGSGYAALCSPPLLWPQSSEDPVSHLLGWPSRYVFLGPVEIGISGPDTQVARDTHLLISFKLKQTSPISFCYRRKNGSQSRY